MNITHDVGDSTIMSFSHDQLSNIPHVLSEPRFATYLRYCDNDRNRALQLYQWNLELSSAFIIPLHILEVSIRNAVVENLEAVHTQNWPWNNGFIRSLPNPRRGYNSTSDLLNVAAREETVGKVVAELKFAFWEKMFTARHDERLWEKRILSSFPNASVMSTAELRKIIHDDIFSIRTLRNRIAHHEPIFSRDVMDDYHRIYKLIRWRDKVTSDWMNEFQSVESLIKEMPLKKEK